MTTDKLSTEKLAGAAEYERMTTTDKPSAGAKIIADKLMALRSALNPTKHQFVWDEMTTLADDINRLTVMPEKLSPPVAGAEVGVDEKLRNDVALYICDGAVRGIRPYDIATSILLHISASLTTPVAERGGGGAQTLQDRDETLRGLAAFFSESVHHVWSNDEIADCLSGMTPTPETGDGSEMRSRREAGGIESSDPLAKPARPNCGGGT